MEPGLRLRFRCGLPWEQMPGDDRSRWCVACGRDIPNLSALTAAEQRRWFASPDRPPCARSEIGLDGWLQSADGGRGLRMATPLPRLGLTLGLAIGAGAASSLPVMPGTPGHFTTPALAPTIDAETRRALETTGYFSNEPPPTSAPPPSAPSVPPEAPDGSSVGAVDAREIERVRGLGYL